MSSTVRGLLSHFRYSLLVTAVCLAIAGWWGQHTAGTPWPAIMIALVLSIMEVSLSFDNAVVNASILRQMDLFWRRMFLTVGILIAVFGMRLLFPIVIVAAVTGDGLLAVARMALNDPEQYSQHLSAHHDAIAAFGGMFLLLVFLSFLLDDGKQIHWLGALEKQLAKLGKLDSVSVVLALIILMGCQQLMPLPQESQLTILVAGLSGVVLYVLVSSLDAFFETDDAHAAMPATAAPNTSLTAKKVVQRSGVAGFIYLEVLDASFSFDGVIGAFAITRDVVIIMLGLTIGAMFVRSITVYLVDRGTLEQFVYLEHGAHYGIGALALIMLAGMVYHVPEVITGLIGVTFIVASIFSSIAYNRRSG